MGLNGNVGNHNSGRKSKREEIEQAIGNITQDALIKLANSKVYKQLVALQDFKDTKEMALPITLRGIVEKKELSGDLVVQIAESIAKKNDTNPIAKPNSQ